MHEHSQRAIWSAFLANLGVAFAFLGLGVFSMLFWSLTTASAVKASDPVVFYSPIGLAVACLIVTIAFGAKYERSRWTTFF